MAWSLWQSVREMLGLVSMWEVVSLCLPEGMDQWDASPAWQCLPGGVMQRTHHAAQQVCLEVRSVSKDPLFSIAFGRFGRFWGFLLI